MAWTCPRVAGRMMMIMMMMVLALLVPALDATASPQKSDAPQRKCYKCEGTGLLPCTGHTAENDVLHCSVNYGRKCCHGLGVVPCTVCKSPEGAAELEERLAAVQAWLDQVADWDKDLESCKDPIVHVETENIHLLFARPKFKSEGRVYDPHRGAHLYAERLEKAHSLYMEIFGLERVASSPKHYVFLFEEKEPFVQFLRARVGQASDNSAGFKFRGNRSWFVTYRLAQDASDEKYHQRVIHNFAHLLIGKHVVSSGQVPVWLDSGFANYLEYELFKANNNYCFVEVMPPMQFSGTGWRGKVRKEAVGGSPMPFVEFSGKDLNAFEQRDHAYSYSYVDFLIEHDIEKFRELAAAIKKGVPTLDAFRNVYGWLPQELDEEWLSYVRTRY